MNEQRLSGILVHPTSFPSRFGIGDLGKSAYDFLDFLARAKQNLWQILPLGPTSFGDSPYQSFSTFAGNYLLISPEILVQEGYLSAEDLHMVPQFDPHTVDYGAIIQYKTGLFKKAFEQFKKTKNAAFEIFCTKNAPWLDDYVLFVSLKSYFIDQRRNNLDEAERDAFCKEYESVLGTNMVNDYYYGAVWATWPKDIKDRKSSGIKKYQTLLSEEIAYQKFLQFEFFRQWLQVKAYANEKGISVVGDIPIFVAYDSCDVWSNPSLFTLDAKGFPRTVAGVPPDYFSATGQLWGNPLYDWKQNEKTGYAWWLQRVGRNLNMMDILRIDHFRGFDTYWEIPFGEPTAVNGKWCNGPGKGLFDAIEKELGTLPIIAEDLGEVNPGTEKLRTSLGFPGMKILQFAFEEDPDNMYLPHNYKDNNMVVYSGTHDNDTTVGWYQKAEEKAKDYYRRYLNVSGEAVAWDLIRLAFSTVARIAIVPIQDVMSLDSASRMNTPGLPSGNWGFRYTEDMLKEEYAEHLKYLTNLYNRNKKEETK